MYCILFINQQQLLSAHLFDLYLQESEQIFRLLFLYQVREIDVQILLAP